MSAPRALRLLSAFVLLAPAAARAEEHAIDLATALELAGARSVDVQIARARLDAARAEATSANLRFLPWITAGVSYQRHGGVTPDVLGNIVTADKDLSVAGAGVSLRVDVGEALFQSLAAKQTTQAAEHVVASQRQQSLLRAAEGYFDLLAAQASVTVAREALRISQEYESQLHRAVEIGIALRGDELRVKVQSQRNQLAVQQALEQRRVLAARLAETLRLDPSVELVAKDAELVPLSLVPTTNTVESLVAEALSARPEVSEGHALVLAAEENRKAAAYGPLIPALTGRLFVDSLSGGPDGAASRSGESRDYVAAVAWRLGPGGILDFGRTRAANARLGESQWTLEKVKDAIARQVVEARTRVLSQQEQLETARGAMATAEQGFTLARERREFEVGIVLENILAEQDQTRARLDYVRAIGEYDKAQYALGRALGRLGHEAAPPQTQLSP
jgi:outer membrane protein TolC